MQPAKSWRAPTFHQRVLIRRGGARQHPQLGPDLIQLLLLHLRDKARVRGEQDPQKPSAPPESKPQRDRTAPWPPNTRTALPGTAEAIGEAAHHHGRAGLGLFPHLSLLVADEPVELLPLQAQEVLPWQQDATLGGDGTGGVDVVPCHHPDSDPCPLALQDGIRHLGDKDRVGGQTGRAPWFCTPCGVSKHLSAACGTGLACAQPPVAAGGKFGWKCPNTRSFCPSTGEKRPQQGAGSAGHCRDAQRSCSAFIRGSWS